MADFLNFFLIGIGSGAGYALLALGAVLIYRGSGVVNFAQGSMGLVGASAYYELRSTGVVVAILGGLAIGAAFGLLVEIVILRRMRRSSPIARMILTLALASSIEGAALVKYGADPISVRGFLPSGALHLGSVSLVYSRLCLLAIACVVTAVLWILFAHTRWGLATFAASESQLVTSAAGWSPHLLAMINWGLGGLLAALAGILIVPLTNLTPNALFLTVIPALAACVVGGWTFPLVLVAAISLGVLESEATLYISAPGWSDAIPLLAILAVLVFRGRPLPLRSYAADKLPRVGSGRIHPGLIVGTLGAGICSIIFLSAGWSVALSYTALGGLLGLSVVVIVGYCGQVSLAQYAIAGIAALVTGQLASHGMPVIPALLLGVVSSLPVGTLVALPALRTRGVSLAIVTLAFGTAVTDVVFANPSWTGGLVNGLRIPTLRVFGIDFDAVLDAKHFAYLCLGVLVAACIVVANLRRSHAGLSMIAVRDNERAAASVGIDVARVKVNAFVTSAALASLAGALFAVSSSPVDFSQFTPLNSITLVLLTVIGGLGFVAGGIVGAAGVVGAVVYYLLLRHISNNDWFPFITAALAIPVLMFKPDGVVTDFIVLMDKARRIWGRAADTLRRGETTDETEGAIRSPLGTRGDAAREDATEGLPPVTCKSIGTEVLVVRGLVVRFASVLAVDAVDLDIRAGEVLGLIGPNGSGKTTLIDAITGYVRAEAGDVVLAGRRIGRLRPHQRARAGIVRSFQSVELFEDLSVRENIVLGERRVPTLTRQVYELLKPSPPALSSWAMSVVRDFELETALDAYPRELSYASRRLAAIAHAVAARPMVLLLDEPAAGLDTVSVRALGETLRRLARTYRIALLLVEHNVSMVLDVSDRVVALDFGRKLASGTPREIRLDSAVVQSYLGTPVRQRGSEQVYEPQRPTVT